MMNKESQNFDLCGLYERKYSSCDNYMYMYLVGEPLNKKVACACFNNFDGIFYVDEVDCDYLIENFDFKGIVKEKRKHK